MSHPAARPISPAAIDFGAPSAERDIERGLEGYFVESEAYNRVRSGAKRIVVGNRGIGKSAIFQVLARRERDEGSYVIELSPEDYSYELLSQTMASQGSGSWAKLGAYAVAWKYLIYVLIMKEVSRRKVHLKKGEASRIYRYIRDHHANDNASKLSALVSYLKRMEGLKIGKYEASVKTRELEKLYKLEEIHHLLPGLEQIASQRRIVVLVDELDRGWDSSEDAQAFVAGLFQACLSVNSLHDNLRVYISLRQELYDDVPALYEDAQKYRDLIENIHWTEASLLKLMANRIRHSLPALAERDDRDCWNYLFAAPPGQPRSQSFGYMIERTLYRPREIIQFSTQVIECAQYGRAGPPWPYGTITEAESLYSADRVRDIAAEYRFQWPGLLSIIEAFRGQPRIVGRDDLELLALGLITGEIPSTGTGGWLDESTPDGLIEILWQVGLLLAEADPAGAAAARTDLRSPADTCFLGPHQARQLRVATAQRFQIHPMFRAYLGTV
jgi:hypothetical protein